ncbi:hypothetical protein CTheo_4208 [Ceratobasidium theobromae]|uniref:Yeast cell wall synthesis Kre9/Knh1-like N-terminal domain-containing protein n=1 Tax=Ceratobasidium theobromae TaxID=1582974 RepID=A0A5N5QL47_9AGAM|nr:hypothetical protein CTheo_4208 [Ceratobasidium theobromae]
MYDQDSSVDTPTGSSGCDNAVSRRSHWTANLDSTKSTSDFVTPSAENLGYKMNALTLLTMRSFAALLGLSLLASSAAYQVTFPAAPGDQWRAGAVTNKLTWQRVNTDPAQFTLVLVNEDRSVLPVNNQLLQANINGEAGEIEVQAPSGGFPAGRRFRVNLVKSSNELNTIFAQSPEFDIVEGPASSTTTSSAAPSTTHTTTSTNTSTSAHPTTTRPANPPVISATGTRTTMVVSGTPAGGPSANGSSTSGVINQTGAPTPNGAASAVARASPVLIICAALALFMA